MQLMKVEFEESEGLQKCCHHKIVVSFYFGKCMQDIYTICHNGINLKCLSRESDNGRICQTQHTIIPASSNT